jgi:hypothetical protein
MTAGLCSYFQSKPLDCYSQTKPNEICEQSTNYKTKFLPPTATFSRHPLTPFSLRTPTQFNAGSGPTNGSSTRVAEKPNAMPSPTSVYSQPTFIHFQAGEPNETNILAQPLSHTRNSAPPECPIITITYPPFPQPFQDLSSKIKSSYATPSNSRSPFPAPPRNN